MPGPRKPVKRKPPRPVALANKTPGTALKKAVVAGPRRTEGRRDDDARHQAKLESLQCLIVTSLENDKAEDVVSLDLHGKATFCDRMIVATGLADRQISAMAEHLVEKLHEAGLHRVQVEGASGAEWVLIDAGDFVVHLFKPEARGVYALERMWGSALDEVVEG
ncbi:MAG: ribosome silencing factor [Acetobacteraceae bacterium]|nr:ribosome silencing factor [Acetobacteraceae bacterium]